MLSPSYLNPADRSELPDLTPRSLPLNPATCDLASPFDDAQGYRSTKKNARLNTDGRFFISECVGYRAVRSPGSGTTTSGIGSASSKR